MLYTSILTYPYTLASCQTQHAAHTHTHTHTHTLCLPLSHSHTHTHRSRPTSLPFIPQMMFLLLECPSLPTPPLRPNKHTVTQTTLPFGGMLHSDSPHLHSYALLHEYVLCFQTLQQVAILLVTCMYAYM